MSRSCIVLTAVALAAWTAGAAVAQGPKPNVIWVDRKSTAVNADGSAGAPFKTVTAALKTAGPGARVVVKAGLYYETLTLPSGEPGRPFVLAGAPGERVIISGAEPLTSWRKHDADIWTTTLDWEPKRLFAGGVEQTIAREPNTGWRETTSCENNTFADAPNLKGTRFDLPGGTATMLLKGGGKYRFTLDAFDPAAGAVTLNPKSLRGRKLEAGDLYFLQNRRCLIDRPGEWAVEQEDGKFKVYFRPRREADLAAADCPKAEIVVHANKAKHVCIEGLEVTGGWRKGIVAENAEDVTITRCVVHDIYEFKGIQSLYSKNVTITRNISWRNKYGIAVDGTTGALVEENEIGWNTVDALIVTWDSHDVLVRRNCIHDHLLWGHPDSIQLYKDVTGARFVENLLLCSGQSMMLEDTSGGEIAGNMIVGSRATMIIMGHGNARDYKIHNNTVAFGRKPITMTAAGYDVRENVLMTGHSGPILSARDAESYDGDRNLLFNGTRVTKGTAVTMGRKWFSTLQEFKQATQKDLDSVYAAPRFVNAPIGYAAVDVMNLHACSRTSLPLVYGAGTFRAGDVVEVNFDDVPRKVKSVEGKVVTIEPAFPERPSSGWVVVNWGENTNFALDLRLRPDSPGARLTEDGKPVGSSIDIQAYLRGDFDGDGKRDIPPLPPALAEHPEG